MKFRSQRKQHYIPFALFCDFECFLTPVDDEDRDAVEFDRGIRPIDEHRVSGFCCYRVSEYPKYQTDPVVYSGPDVMSRFYEHVMAQSRTLSEIVKEGIAMIPLTEQQQSTTPPPHALHATNPLQTKTVKFVIIVNLSRERQLFVCCQQ